MFTENLFCKFWKTFFVYAIFFPKICRKLHWPLQDEFLHHVESELNLICVITLTWSGNVWYVPSKTLHQCCSYLVFDVNIMNCVQLFLFQVSSWLVALCLTVKDFCRLQAQTGVKWVTFFSVCSLVFVCSINSLCGCAHAVAARLSWWWKSCTWANVRATLTSARMVVDRNVK